MKFQISRDSLYKALKNLKEAVPTKPDELILSTVKLELIENHILQLTTTNINDFIIEKIPVIIEDSTVNNCCVSFQKLFKILKVEKSNTLIIQLQNTIIENRSMLALQITISNKKTEYILVAETATSFYNLPIKKEGYNLVLQPLFFKQALQSCIYASKEADKESVLFSILLQFKNTGLDLIANDGYKLVVNNFQFFNQYELPETFNSSFILSYKIATLLEKLITTDTLKVIFDFYCDSHLSITINNVQIVTHCLLLSYPDLTTLLNSLSHYPEKLVVNKELLKQKLISCTAFAKSKGHSLGILLQNIDQQLFLNINNSELGVFNDSIPLISNCDSVIKFHINVFYLLEALENIYSENVIIKILPDSTNPILLQSESQYTGFNQKIYIAPKNQD